MDCFDRYLKIEDWARRRYSRAGRYTSWVGNGVAGLPDRDGKAFLVPSIYSMIEDLAAERYLKTHRHWPDFTLNTAHRD